MLVGFFQATEIYLPFLVSLKELLNVWIFLPQKHFGYKKLEAEMDMKIIFPGVGKKRMECHRPTQQFFQELGFVPLEPARGLGTIQWDGLRGNCWHPFLKNNSVLPSWAFGFFPGSSSNSSISTQCTAMILSKQKVLGLSEDKTPPNNPPQSRNHSWNSRHQGKSLRNQEWVAGWLTLSRSVVYPSLCCQGWELIKHLPPSWAPFWVGFIFLVWDYKTLFY